MVGLTDRPAMTRAVDLGRKATKQTNKQILKSPNFDSANSKCFTVKLKVTTGNNNHNFRKTKHIFPNNFNICYCIYLKLSGINGLDMPDAIIMH